MISFFYIVLIASSLLMLACSNPINSILFIILTFLSASNIFFLIGCDFLGLVFVIIYLGAIAVLFLFIVMMINVKKLEGDSTTYLLIGVLLFFIFFIQVSYHTIDTYEYEAFQNVSKNSNLYFFYSIDKRDTFSKSEYFQLLGRLLYLDMVLFTIMVSFLLLVGMLGSIYLTNYKNNFSSKKQFNQLSRNNKLINLHLV